MNKQAQQALLRCQKYIKEDEGESYVPNAEDIELPDLPELKKEETPESATAAAAANDDEPTVVEVPETSASSGATPAAAQVEPKEEVKKEPQPVEPEPVKTAEEVNYKEIATKLTALKERGNGHFQKKAHK